MFIEGVVLFVYIVLISWLIGNVQYVYKLINCNSTGFTGIVHWQQVGTRRQGPARQHRVQHSGSNTVRMSVEVDDPDDVEVDDPDDMPQLSAHALSALQEFYSEQTQREQETLVTGPAASTTGNALLTGPAALATGQMENCSMPQEDWGLSQFWYDDETAYKLAQEALLAAGDTGSIACVSAPTVYAKIRQLKQEQSHSTKTILFEYDKRFSKFGDDFVFYDYNDPLNVDEKLREQFDIVLVDPPFLSEECLCKTAMTVRFLAKHKIILSTGSVMAAHADRLLHLKACDFIPAHEKQLGNEFRCYTNFDPVYLKNSS